MDAIRAVQERTPCLNGCAASMQSPQWLQETSTTTFQTAGSAVTSGGCVHASLPMNNRRTWIIAATLAVLAGGGCWWAFADGEDAALITAPARVAGLEKTVQAVGRVNPKELVAVGAQVSGQVTRLHVVLGQHVQAGDLIAEVDSQPQRIACAVPKPPPTRCVRNMRPARRATARPFARTIANRSWWRRGWSRRKASKRHVWRAMRRARMPLRCRRRSTRR